MKPPVIIITMLALLACARAAELRLPDPLTANDGARITSVTAWSKRRAELLELFRANIYGRTPVGRPDSLKFDVTEVATNAMAGKATRKQVRISYRGPGGDGAIKLVLFTPNALSKPAPCFLLICNRSITNIDATRENKSEFWPAEELIARGYAAAAFY
ncbi:MAG TPA: hypothetical protein VK530_01735, partial [Candidatus Acidoferrum sp.]|nr:hypothetical protein [Candidatus Acidoferrum sp.]